MQNYSSWRDVPIPPRLASRPRDARGYPIPALVLVDSEGKPDFKTTDLEKWSRAYHSRTCSLCGQTMGRHLAFIGGPNSYKYRYFTDLPMHRDCAEYAIKVCPYIAVPNFKYAENIRAPDGYTLSVSNQVSPDRPDRFVLAITTSCKAERLDGDTLAVKAAPWESVTWWRDGVQLSEADVVQE